MEGAAEIPGTAALRAGLEDLGAFNAGLEVIYGAPAGGKLTPATGDESMLDHPVS